MVTITDEPIFRLADIAGKGQADFQRDYQAIDPVVGIMRSLRDSGFAADAMTIDCIRSGKRIICLLHDNNPEVVDYQFGYRDRDPDATFQQIALSELTASQFYSWMKDYFVEVERS